MNCKGWNCCRSAQSEQLQAAQYRDDISISVFCKYIQRIFTFSISRGLKSRFLSKLVYFSCNIFEKQKLETSLFQKFSKELQNVRGSRKCLYNI